jgi:alkylated DNA repair dioxygenase AlkB
MSTPQEYFKNNKYVHITKILDNKTCSMLSEHLKNLSKEIKNGDSQCPMSPSIYGDPVFDTLLEDLKPAMEESTGLKLNPTYSYARFYKPGDKLDPHTDRRECEISATITLGFDGDLWPIWLSESTDVRDNPKEYRVELGDALIYRGMEINHWRQPYKEGNWQCQVFLHYVDANGKYKDLEYDGRKTLKTQKQPVVQVQKTRKEYDNRFWYFGNKQEEKHLWVYEEKFLSSGLIELIVEEGKLQLEEATVGYGGSKQLVDKKIRNAYTSAINPENFSWLYKLIEKEVAKQNLENYKFNLDRIEHLSYIEYHADDNSPGKYDKHTDGVIHMTRKLSFSLFLSDPDEYEGGDLIIHTVNGLHKIPKKKGLIVFFPAYAEHEVTPVTKGVRKSLVGWIHGPHFT